MTAVAARCLLHLEVLRDSGSRSLEDGVHLRIVREQLHRLRAVDPASAITADLHLALALQLQGQLHLEDLRLYFEDVGDSFASYGPFLLAKATLVRDPGVPPARGGEKAALVPGAKDSLARAERILRGALEIEPKADEVRLRLAHVLASQSRPDEAQRLLEAILQGPAEPSTRYLAQLFLGQVHVTTGRLSEAKTSYAAGRADCACGQAASVALAHLTFREGRPDAAREILGNLDDPLVCVDPWSVYDFGQIAKLDGVIVRLREAVRQQVTLTWAAAIALSALQGQGLPGSPRFTSTTELVRLDVLAHHGGAPLRGLAADDFEVRDNGVPQKFQLIPLTTSHGSCSSFSTRARA